MWAIVVTEKPRGKPLWLREVGTGRMYHFWRRKDAAAALAEMIPQAAAGKTLGMRPFWGEEIPS